jgi:hypothetical protein
MPRKKDLVHCLHPSLYTREAWVKMLGREVWWDGEMRTRTFTFKEVMPVMQEMTLFLEGKFI